MAFYIDLFSPETYNAFSDSSRSVSGFRRREAAGGGEALWPAYGTLRETINVTAYALGGEVGARLSERIGLECSDAILRELEQVTAAISGPAGPNTRRERLGWRKGQKYGTILVNLERRRPIDLLPDRSARSFQRWLRTS